MALTNIDQCLCGSANPAADCCAPFHEGIAAPTAESLMRSRYVAYVLRLELYLLATWHPSTRPTELKLDEGPPKWLGLSIKHHQLQDDNHATVEFVARYKIDSRAYRLHETSRFVHEEGRWFYIDGDVHNR